MTGYELAFPFRLGPDRDAASASYSEHVDQMIEQVLLTDPGERVNLPEFGCGLMRMVFTPLSSTLAPATETLVHSALVRWLGDVIEVESVDVSADDAQLDITVSYRLLVTGANTSTTVTVPATP